jgi:hypothetical protein
MSIPSDPTNVNPPVPEPAGAAAPHDEATTYMADARRAGAECLQAALDYLTRGWASLADCPPDHVGVGKTHGQKCKHPGKAPWGAWKELQTRLPTEAELREKWRANPTLNVGLALGPVSGLVRVDVDGPGGERLLAELSGGDLPDTLEFTSGRDNGGRGLLYAIPPGVELKTTPLRPGEAKTELRFQAKGAQTVLPPSRHSSGCRYAWRPGHSPDEIKAAPMPGWLITHMRAGRKGGGADANGKPRTAAAWAEKFAGVEQGARNETAAEIAGKILYMVANLDDPAQVETARLCLVSCNKNNTPVLDDDELRSVFVSILGREKEKRAAAAGGTPTADTPAPPGAIALGFFRGQNVPVARFRKLGEKNPHYEAILDDDRTLDLGNATDLLTLRLVRPAVLAATGKVLEMPHPNSKESKQLIKTVVESITAAAETVNIGTDDDLQLRNWITQVIDRRLPPPDRHLDEDNMPIHWGTWIAENNRDVAAGLLSDGPFGCNPVVRADGRVYLRSEKFHEWLTGHKSGTLDYEKLCLRLRALGWVSTQITFRRDGKHQKIRALVSPPGWAANPFGDETGDETGVENEPEG